MLSNRHTQTVKRMSKEEAPVQQSHVRCEALLANGTVVRGPVPHAAMALKFIFNAYGDAGVLYQLPLPDMRSMRLRTNMLYNQMNPLEAAIVPEAKKVDDKWHLCVNVESAIDYRRSLASVQRYDAANGTAYAAQFSAFMSVMQKLRSGEVVRLIARAIILSQYYEFYSTFFELDYHLFLRIRSEDIIGYHAELAEHGIGQALNPRHLRISPIAKRPRANNNNNNNNNNAAASQAQGRAEDEGESEPSEDELLYGSVGSDTIQLRLKTDTVMKMLLKEAEGGAGDDHEDEDEEDGEEDEAKKAEQAKLRDFFKVGVKRQRVEAAKSKRVVIRQGDDDSDESQLVILATSSKLARPKIPSVSGIEIQKLVTALMFEYLARTHFTDHHMYMTEQMLAAYIQERNGKNDFIAVLDLDCCWRGFYQLARAHRVVLYHQTVFARMELPETEEAWMDADSPIRKRDVYVVLPFVIKAEERLTGCLDNLVRNGNEYQEAGWMLDRGVDFTRLTKNTLAPEQIEGFVRAVTSPLSIISGPAGTGKSELQKIIYLYLRSELKKTEEYGEGFLFVSFKNDTVAQTRAAIHEIDPTAVDDPTLTFRTVDSVCFSARTEDASNLDAAMKTVVDLVKGDSPNRMKKWSVAFIDEASFVCTSKISLLLEHCPDLKHLILFGDVLQLPPISPGFAFLHICNHFAKSRTQLVRNFRAESPEIGDFLQCIREMNSEAVEIRDPDVKLSDDEQKLSGKCFCHHSILRVSEVGYQNMHMPYCNALMERLEKLDPEKKLYRDIMVVTPYNQVARAVSIKLSQYYFGINNDWGIAMIQAYACGKPRNNNNRSAFDPNDESNILGRGAAVEEEKKDSPNPAPPREGFGAGGGPNAPDVVVGCRVVFKATNKEMDPGICTGKSGFVTAIYDMPKGGTLDPANAMNMQVASMHERPKAGKGVFFTRCVEVDAQITATFTYAKKIDELIELEGCCTVHRSQGRQSAYVFVLLPDLNRLDTNDVLYTACSRAQRELWVFGRQDHLQHMIETRSEPCNSLLPDLLSITLPIHDEEGEYESLVKRIVDREIIKQREMSACVAALDDNLNGTF